MADLAKQTPWTSTSSILVPLVSSVHPTVILAVKGIRRFELPLQHFNHLKKNTGKRMTSSLELRCTDDQG